MNPVIRSFLIELARQRTNQTINYTNLCNELNLKYDMSIPYHRVQLGDELEKISRYEHENERPLLSSLVTRKFDMDQGDGFYKMCEDMGFGNWKKLKTNETFQTEKIIDTINFWQDENKYMKYR